MSTRAINPMMPKADAKRAVQMIRSCLDGAAQYLGRVRRVVVELKEKQGWLSLGYKSWRACVVKEFGKSERHLYRQIEAAKIEREICPTGQIGTIEERKLRPLGNLGTPAERREAWQGAEDLAGGEPTVGQVETITARILSRMTPAQQKQAVEQQAELQAQESARVDERSEIVHVEKAHDLTVKLYRKAKGMHRDAVRSRRHLIKFKRLGMQVMKQSAALERTLADFLEENLIEVQRLPDEERRTA